MNSEKNWEDDDDLEMLDGDPNTFKSSGATGTTTTPFGCNKRKSSRDNEVVESSGKEFKIPKSNASDVWAYFDKLGLVDEKEKCKCKKCGAFYTCGSAAGTSHLKRHLDKCLITPQFHDVGALLDNQATPLKKWKFDANAYRDSLARSIIKHDLPFSYAEYNAVIATNKILNPEFQSVSRNTAKSDCLSVYMIEKAKLKSMLANIPGRICLTSDAWTAVTVKGYMTVTAHYVDQKWKLNSKLLAFVELDSPHTADELSRQLLRVLGEWGISSKIFSITLDNAATNDAMLKLVKQRLNATNGLLCKGEFLHVRCCAHILNLIVQDGLKEASKSVEKIKESVKYVKASEGRLKQFRKCIEEGNLGNVGGGFLRLDVSTRWNATYLMLESAIKYRWAFSNMCLYDKNFKCCPTDEEWERGAKMRSFLGPFYTITNLMSGSSYPTSNLYFMQIARIQMKLQDNLYSEDQVIREMTRKMKLKFDKYWDECSLVLACGSVLDPKSKLHFLGFCYKKLYPESYQEKVDKVKVVLYKLFKEYEQIEAVSSTSREVPSRPNPIEVVDEDSETLFREYTVAMSQFTFTKGKSDLDVYLNEIPDVSSDVDVLDYWRLNKKRFPQLARMACDVLSILITTVASESSFSIGGRILHKYRSCLHSENVEALICTRNWLHGFEEIGPPDGVEFEEIPLFTEDSDIVSDEP